MPKKTRKHKSYKHSNKIWYYVLAGLVLVALIWWISTQKNPDTQEPEQVPVRQSPQGADGEIQTSPVGENLLDTAIKEAAQRLNVPENALRKTYTEELDIYKLPLDRSSTDLTFANMIVKGQVELRGGVLVRGTETGNKQVLIFKHNEVERKSQVELYYDSTVYQNRSTGKNIAIVVDDFGTIGGELLDGFFALDRAVSFAILPGQNHSSLTMEKAQAQGREALIHVPMEPIGYPGVDPGPEAILVRMTESEIERMLNRFIHQLPYCKGINNHMGSLATSDELTMERVMKVLREKGKYFLDSRTTNVSVAYQTAQKAHIPAFQNKIFLDSPDVSDATFEAKFQQIVNMSQTNPNLIAITHCHNRDKLNYLRRFIQRLEAEGFNIVPVSALGQTDLPQIL